MPPHLPPAPRLPAPLSAHLWRIARSLINAGRKAMRDEPLQAAAVTTVILVTWAIIIGTVLGLIHLLNQPLYLPMKQRLLEVLLALFLFTLSVMVVISDVVLVWSGLFRTRAAWFQAALPCTDRGLFWAAALEGGLWAGWAVVVLVAPLVGTLALEAAQPLLYLPVAILAVLAFIACCLAAGSLGALLLARLIPLLRRGLPGLFALSLAAVVLGIPLALAAFEERSSPVTFMNEVIGKLAFAENPYLPSWWTQQALNAALASRWPVAFWHIALTALTAAGIAVLAEELARRRLRLEFDLLAGRPDRSRGQRSRTWRLPPLLPADLGLLIAKDFRLFLRDPAQLVQVTMFFGLLGFYLMLLPRLGAAFKFDPQWKLAVSVLNLTAIGMAVATFTGRFVYPMPSLEGRRLWVLCLAPFPRQRIITGKYVFALLVGLPISIALTALSGWMLELPITAVVAQTAVMACLVTGMAAAALGLGARHADYHEDNPAKLVSGYGGTLNLMASLIFTGALVIPAGITLIPVMPGWVTAVAGLWIGGLSLVWTWGFLALARRAFDRAGEAR